MRLVRLVVHRLERRSPPQSWRLVPPKARSQARETPDEARPFLEPEQHSDCPTPLLAKAGSNRSATPLLSLLDHTAKEATSPTTPAECLDRSVSPALRHHRRRVATHGPNAASCFAFAAVASFLRAIHTGLTEHLLRSRDTAANLTRCASAQAPPQEAHKPTVDTEVVTRTSPEFGIVRCADSFSGILQTDPPPQDGPKRRQCRWHQGGTRTECLAALPRLRPSAV